MGFTPAPPPEDDDIPVFPTAPPPEEPPPPRRFQIRPRLVFPVKRKDKAGFTFELLEQGSRLSEWPDLESAKDEAERIASGQPVEFTVLPTRVGDMTAQLNFKV